MEAQYLSKEVHLLHDSHVGCFRVWDEEKHDVVVAADIKPLSILPGVNSFLQGQQSHRPGRQGEDGDHVLQSPCKISVDEAAKLQGPGNGLPDPSLQQASSHSAEPILGTRGGFEAAIGHTHNIS